MIKFKLNGKPLSIPSSWIDITLDQHINLINNKAGINGAISILTGISIEALKKAKFEGLDMVIQAMNFLKKAPEYDGTVTQLGKYQLPLNSKGDFDIQFETLGQFEDLKACMAKVKESDTLSIFRSYAEACAIYAQKIRDGEYMPDKAQSMIHEVYQMPAHQVITAGSFFFLKLLSLLNGIDQTSQPTNQNRKKSKPALRNSKRNSVHTRQSRKSR